jgi:hypothetical protein
MASLVGKVPAKGAFFMSALQNQAIAKGIQN